MESGRSQIPEVKTRLLDTALCALLGECGARRREGRRGLMRRNAGLL